MKKPKLRIVIATTSKDKIEGIKEAFYEFFPREKFDLGIYAGKTESNVPEQPFGNDTYQGAINRIENIRRKYEEFLKEHNMTADYYVSCEAGIDNTNKVIIKGKEQCLYASEQIVCIYNPVDDSYFFGKSSSWTIPQKEIKEIKEENLDKYLQKRECKGLQDIANGKYITRKEAIKQGAVSALASSEFVERNARKKKESNKEMR